MPEDLDAALAQVRELLADGADDGTRLVRAIAAGRRRGAVPAVSRVELRPVDLKAGRRLQVVEQHARGPRTRNLAAADVPAVLDAMLAEPYGNWHIETREAVVQLRVTKKGQAQVHRSATDAGRLAQRGHDRVKDRLVDTDDPLFAVLGAGADKRRQVDAFLRLLEPALQRARDAGLLPADEVLRVVDLGCGSAYLTLAAHRWLASQGAVRTAGVELRDNLVARSAERAAQAGLDGVTFTAGTIAGAQPVWDDGLPASRDGGGERASPAPDVHVVLSLHACDTATDEALARAVRWGAPLVLAAPCCHHDLQAQLGGLSSAPSPYGMVVRHPILRERFADVLTDALRAAVLRLLGYRVDVVEFVASRHTPRNVMLRAVRTGAAPTPGQVEEYRELTRGWGVEPALARMLADELAAVLGPPPPCGDQGIPGLIKESGLP